jgi:hypothetical protein
MVQKACMDSEDISYCLSYMEISGNISSSTSLKKVKHTKNLLLFCTTWRTPTETRMCKKDSNASGQVTNRQYLTREVRILGNEDRKRPKLTNRPLCHLAISNGQFSTHFSLFATNLHNHLSDPRITWRSLVFYDTL